MQFSFIIIVGNLQPQQMQKQYKYMTIRYLITFLRNLDLRLNLIVSYVSTYLAM